MEEVVRISATLSKVVDVIRRASFHVIPSRSILRLDDILWVREPVEDSGEFTASLLEYSSRPLIARRPYRGDVKVTPIGVDSSSRYLETPVADIVIGGVVALSSLSVFWLEWPSLGTPIAIPGRVHPVFYILPNSDRGLSIDDPLISTVNPAGREFDISYSVEEACDEMRVSLENWMLELLGVRVLELDNPVILVDGPLFIVAKALVREAPPWLRDVWVKLLGDRVKAVRELEAKGVPVIGVVKRVEKSTILSRTRGFEVYRGNVLEGDRSIIMKLLSMTPDRVPGRVYVTPKILVRLPGVPGAGSLDKIVQYMVIPPGKYQVSSPLARVYRIEYTPRGLELLNKMGLEPEDIIGFDSIGRGALEPLSVRLSDLRSSYITQAFKRMLAMSIISAGAPLGYWDLREVEATWR